VTAAPGCPDPHPTRADRSLDPHPDLERLGGEGEDAWYRCRNCGAFVWLTTDDSSKYQFMGAWELERELARKAFVERSVPDGLDLLLHHELPQGPMWCDEDGLIVLLRAVASGANDAALVDALRGANLDERWSRVLSRLERGRSAEAKEKIEPGPPLPFVLDIPFEGEGIDELHELTHSLVGLRTGSRPELVRVDASGIVTRTALPGEPRFLGRTLDCVAFSVETPVGHRVMAIDDGGRVIGWPPNPAPAYALRLDGGHWLLFTRTEVSTGQIFDPAWKLLFTVRFALRSDWFPAPPRRFADGWIMSAVLDRAGLDHPLTFMVPERGVLAVSEEVGTGGRLVEPLSATTLLAETLKAPFTLETWVLEGERLVRQDERLVESWRVTGDVAVALLRDGHSPALSLVRLRPDGGVAWQREVQRSSRGTKVYLAEAPGAVLVYGDQDARLIANDDGRDLDAFPILGPIHVLGDARPATYVLTGDELRIITTSGVRVVPVPAGDLEKACGDGILLKLRTSGRHRLVGPDGATRGDFDARGARISVIGTRGGPHVLEPDRLRVGKWPGQLW
jgi:hypothetical protein